MLFLNRGEMVIKTFTTIQKHHINDNVVDSQILKFSFWKVTHRYQNSPPHIQGQLQKVIKAHQV